MQRPWSREATRCRSLWQCSPCEVICGGNEQRADSREQKSKMLLFWCFAVSTRGTCKISTGSTRRNYDQPGGGQARRNIGGTFFQPRVPTGRTRIPAALSGWAGTCTHLELGVV